MVERNLHKDVCKGTTEYDQLKAMVYDNEPKEGRVETMYTDNGMALQYYTSLPHFPQFGDKEFPHSRLASSLVTREHEGVALSSDDKKMLAGYRQFPNSDSMGYMAGLEKQGKMTSEMAAEFLDMKREAGCIRPAKVSHDGSIEFPAQKR
ncbi:MAG: hypothetical protein JST89_18100 [Cyanobacteria bacterium SZAS-4]|nr:hypothetical protein [Cyanobacteria bacterium SZAS-4]